MATQYPGSQNILHWQRKF